MGLVVLICLVLAVSTTAAEAGGMYSGSDSIGGPTVMSYAGSDSIRGPTTIFDPNAR
ncbi:MAG: hypothetical protein XD72_1339 [Methanothrix harundinacea]|jgi:hypothetical protein|uniref:Uncharacterized protein n=1 Tax=Methanothrix harundinacea TaxID=301375 RepID=A0A117LFG8_9EURY|nr:MAG: hypothetical protein XD72_1339 [Methanothrix harundinacea]KUK95697.1 MAG: hypothetical protein XE07_1637 [Methanothrix harundinacea]